MKLDITIQRMKMPQMPWKDGSKGNKLRETSNIAKNSLKMIGNPTKTELDSVRLLPKQKMRSGIFLISVIRIRNGRKS